MKKPSSNDAIFAIEDRIRKWLPEVTIMRQWQTGGVRPETMPLNVFIETGGRDLVTGDIHNPDNSRIFPFVFIEQMPRLRLGRERIGVRERYRYNCPFAIRFYIDQNPNDRQRVPRLAEELRNIELQLERVLRYIEINGVAHATQANIPSSVSDGVLHMFVSVEVSEITVPEEFDKVQDHDMTIKLRGDI